MDTASEDTQNVRRDRAWIEREYGREKWPSIEAQVAAAIAAEDGDASLSRVIGRVVAEERRGAGALADQATVIGGEQVAMPRAAAFAAHQAVVLELLRERCSQETDLIVELGAGWGRNLLTGWLSGLPAESRYVACELTEAGRSAAELASSVEDGLALDTLAFDLSGPDLSTLRGAAAVVFSVHAVEQVPELPEALIDEVLALAPRVEVFHLEPVGFQVAGDTAGSTAAYAERHDYNRNLVELLRGAAASGRIELDPSRVDVVGVNPANASTIVSWRTP